MQRKFPFVLHPVSFSLGSSLIPSYTAGKFYGARVSQPTPLRLRENRIARRKDPDVIDDYALFCATPQFIRGLEHHSIYS